MFNDIVVQSLLQFFYRQKQVTFRIIDINDLEILVKRYYLSSTLLFTIDSKLQNQEQVMREKRKQQETPISITYRSFSLHCIF
jgi:hypothetical protein